MNKIKKDKNYRFKFNFIEKKKLLFEFLMYNKSLNYNRRFIYSFVYYNKHKKYFLRSKIKNYCIISYKSRGVLSKFKISRNMFKKFSTSGYIKNILKK